MCQRKAAADFLERSNLGEGRGGDIAVKRLTAVAIIKVCWNMALSLAKTFIVVDRKCIQVQWGRIPIGCRHTHLRVASDSRSEDFDQSSSRVVNMAGASSGWLWRPETADVWVGFLSSWPASLLSEPALALGS